MLEGRKILITGPAGQIAFPLAKKLAERNEVWGIARFSKPEQRQEVEAAGIKISANCRATSPICCISPSASIPITTARSAQMRKAPACCCPTAGMSRRRS
jgi:NAD(P)-dependent dehydrogenase (short-subunit alcohol dehydrogenase family)